MFKARQFDSDLKNYIEYDIQLIKPSLEKMNYEFEISEDQKSIYYGFNKIKYLSEASYNLLKQHLTKEDRKSFDGIISKKYTETTDKGDKERRLIGKTVFQALVYSGSLDYLGKSRNEMIREFNEKYKSNVEEIKDEKHQIELESDYCGISFNNNDKLAIIKEILKDQQYSLKDFFEETGEVPSQVIDYVQILEKKDKVSKNNKKYCLLKLGCLHGTYSPVFSWNGAINSSLKQGDEVIASFTKNGTFVNIGNITEKL
jgi:DNA polymerase III alpha subunit